MSNDSDQNGSSVLKLLIKQFHCVRSYRSKIDQSDTFSILCAHITSLNFLNDTPFERAMFPYVANYFLLYLDRQIGSKKENFRIVLEKYQKNEVKCDISIEFSTNSTF
jgi:hypothetical protein